MADRFERWRLGRADDLELLLWCGCFCVCLSIYVWQRERKREGRWIDAHIDGQVNVNGDSTHAIYVRPIMLIVRYTILRSHYRSIDRSILSHPLIVQHRASGSKQSDSQTDKQHKGDAKRIHETIRQRKRLSRGVVVVHQRTLSLPKSYLCATLRYHIRRNCNRRASLLFAGHRTAASCVS